MSKPLRIGIIGANWSLKVHGSAWRLLDDVEVAAVCTAHRETAETAAQQFGIGKAYWDVREMAADPDIDVIDVGSRPSFRYDMVMAALQGGKHVYNALPFAVNLARAREMHAEQEKLGLIGVVDAQFRWTPAGLLMKQMVDEGYLGTPLGFNVQLLMPLRNYDDRLYPHCVWPEGGISPYLWLGDPTSGAGGWRNFGTHTTLLLTHLIGPVEEVCGQVSTGVKRWTLPDGSVIEPSTYDLGSATMKMANGAIGNLQTGWSVPDSACLRVEVWGDRGRLLLEDPTFGDGVSAKLFAGDGRLPGTGPVGEWLEIPDRYYAVPGTAFSKQHAPPYMVSMGWMFHGMREAIAGRGPASPSFAEAAHAHAVVEALELSQRERRFVRIGDI